MKNRTRMPALFIGHGSPMNLVLENSFTHALGGLGKILPRPDAILVVSAHWLTRGVFVTASPQPDQLYDFFGFPDELYAIRYNPPGAPDIAGSIAKTSENLKVRLDDKRGIDHAAWVVLRHMYPDADIPVLELSLDMEQPEYWHFEAARALAPLRDQGILIIGSGNAVHNLAVLDFSNIDTAPFGWALRTDETIRRMLTNRDDEGLTRFPHSGTEARMAVPSNDHYLPLLYAAALRGPGETLKFVFEGFHYGSLSMRCFQIG